MPSLPCLRSLLRSRQPVRGFYRRRTVFLLKAGRNIDVGADLSCVGAIYSGGTLRVGGSVLSQGEIISPQDAFVGNTITATGLTAKGHVRIDGSLFRAEKCCHPG